MSEATDKADALLQSEVVYDGAGHSREGLQSMLTEYQDKHKTNLKSLSELSQAHDDLAAEMTQDLVEQKSAWDHLKNIVTFQNVGRNMRGLLEKMPLIGDRIPDRPINELLEEKIEVGQRRVQQIGNYLDTMHEEVSHLQADITRLNKKMVVAAFNEEKPPSTFSTWKKPWSLSTPNSKRWMTKRAPRPGSSRPSATRSSR